MAETSPGFFGKGGTGSDILGAVPYIGAGIGLLQSVFGKSEAQQRKERIDALKKQNEMRRGMALDRIAQLKSGGIKDISSNTATQLGRTQSDVARRAAAMGRTGDTESMMLPATSNINESGSKSLENAIQYYDTQSTNTAREFDNRAMDIESDAAARPLDTNFAGDLQNIGAQFYQYQQGEKALEYGKDYNDKWLEMLGGGNNKPSTMNNSFINKKSYFDTTPRLRY